MNTACRAAREKGGDFREERVSETGERLGELRLKNCAREHIPVTLVWVTHTYRNVHSEENYNQLARFLRRD